MHCRAERRAGVNERMWQCVACETVHHRDTNAAKNMLRAGRAAYSSAASFPNFFGKLDPSQLPTGSNRRWVSRSADGLLVLKP